MGVTVREKIKGSNVYWLFIDHHGNRKSKKIGDKFQAKKLAKIVEGRLAAGDLGIGDINKNTTKPFSHYCKQWLDIIVPAECKSSTQRDYHCIHRKHLKSAPWYNKAVDEITEDDIETYLIGKRQKLAKSTVQHIKNALSNSFKRALKSRVIKTNPCVGALIPKHGAKMKAVAEPFNSDEIDQVLEAFRSTKWYCLVLFLARSGVRSGEAAGLQWCDVDLVKGKATICRGVVAGKLMDSTKNGKSRTIDLSPMLIAELRLLKDDCDIGSYNATGDNQDNHGVQQHHPDWVFKNSTGGFIHMDNFRSRTWYPMLLKEGMRRVRIHSLRHSYASMLINRTKDIHYCSKQLGHHSIQVTVDRYTHLLDGDGGGGALVCCLDG